MGTSSSARLRLSPSAATTATTTPGPTATQGPTATPATGPTLTAASATGDTGNELLRTGLPRISTTTKTKKHREEPLSEETLHKTKLTDNECRRTKKEKPYLKFKQQC